MKKNKKVYLRIIGVIMLVLIILLMFGWSMIKKEHNHMHSLEIESIDFKRLNDGEYYGYYEGGVYGWRENTVMVDIDSGKLVGIKVVDASEKYAKDLLMNLFGRIIDAQSLDVDTVSGATLTSKGLLKSIQHALKEAME